jgi:flagellar motility protein MotE (MotC chaperone)
MQTNAIASEIQTDSKDGVAGDSKAAVARDSKDAAARDSKDAVARDSKDAVARNSKDAVAKNSKDAVAGDSKEAEEEKIDINFLIMKKAALEEEEKRLAKKEAEIMAIQQEINNKIEKLTLLRNEIRSETAAKKTVEDQKLKHLIKVYSAMKPQNAAGLIEKLDKKLAIELLSMMKGEDVGKILSYVNIEKATAISEGLAKR